MWKSSLFVLVLAFLLNEHISSGDMMQCVEAIEQLPGEILEFPIDIICDIIELIKYRLCHFWILTDVVVYFTDWCDVDEITNTTEPTTSCPEIEPYKKPKDCFEVLANGNTETGVYAIWPLNRVIGNKSIDVYCDMDTDGGGWTVLLKRDYSSTEVNFTRDWIGYKNGFGDMQINFWIGNDNMYALSNQKQYEVRFDVKDVNETKGFAVYASFWIEPEEAMYRLHLGACTTENVIGPEHNEEEDSMGYQNNMKFSTYDKDNDNDTSVKNGCAMNFEGGGWWYNECCTVCLSNNPYWYSWGWTELATADMKLRPQLN